MDIEKLSILGSFLSNPMSPLFLPPPEKGPRPKLTTSAYIGFEIFTKSKVYYSSLS